LAVALAAPALATPARAVEDYIVTATTDLALTDDGALEQAWSATCLGTDIDAGAALSPGGKELRLAAAPAEPIVVGADSRSFAIGPEASGTYRYEGVAGAHVFARFTARCGRAELADTVTVDSGAVVVPPTLVAPFAVQRTDSLAPVAGNRVPVGVEVELVNVRVGGAPRGDETIEVRVDGPGVAFVATLGPDEFRAGQAVLSPRLTADAEGVLVLSARFLGAEAVPVTLTVAGLEDDDEGEGRPGGPGFVGGGSACSGGLPAPAAGWLPFALLGLALGLGLARPGASWPRRGARAWGWAWQEQWQSGARRPKT
jgi:hypothetical protein